MDKYTVSQRVRIIETYYEMVVQKNAYCALRDFFGITNQPSERTIINIVLKFKETGLEKS